MSNDKVLKLGEIIFKFYIKLCNKNPEYPRVITAMFFAIPIREAIQQGVSPESVKKLILECYDTAINFMERDVDSKTD